ncbi:hypothetical protein AC15_4776 [Escherichia coli 2-156-04_S3_C2]|nr:hypothetical protein AC15_4776 [Escherichia coli 2-156-04_S3_C2]
MQLIKFLPDASCTPYPAYNGRFYGTRQSQTIPLALEVGTYRWAKNENWSTKYAFD